MKTRTKLINIVWEWTKKNMKCLRNWVLERDFLSQNWLGVGSEFSIICSGIRWILMNERLLMDIQNINGYPRIINGYPIMPTFIWACPLLIRKNGLLMDIQKWFSAHLPRLCPLFLQNWACVFCGKIGKNWVSAHFAHFFFLFK